MRRTKALLLLGAAIAIGGSDAAAQSGGRHIRVRKDVGTGPVASDTTAYLGNTGTTGVPGSNGMNDTTGNITEEMSGGEVALPPRMSDANIVAHLASSDSLEIRMAQMALTQAQDPRVRDLAQMILTDHQQNLQQGMALAQRNGITPQPAPGDTMAQRMMRMMDRMSSMGGSMGARFDTMFVARQVMMHQHTLDQLQRMRGVAQSGAVRQQIDATIPVIRKHLDAARQLAQTMGIDTSRMGSMRRMPGMYMRDSTNMRMNDMGDTTNMRMNSTPDTTGMRMNNPNGTPSPNGTTTVNGTNGANYPNGTTNTNGMPVSPGAPGTNGTNGTTGTTGTNGTTGTPANPGTPGSVSPPTGKRPPTF